MEIWHDIVRWADDFRTLLCATSKFSVPCGYSPRTRNHIDTENSEIAQRRSLCGTLQVGSELWPRRFAHQRGFGFPFHRATQLDQEMRLA
jgi:hypothetical protein